AAAEQLIKNADAFHIEDLVIHSPLELSETEATVQVVADPKSDREITCQIFSHDNSTDEWKLHANATVRAIAKESVNISLAEIQARCQELISADEHYQNLAERGLSFGPAFRGVSNLRRGKNDVLAQINVPDAITDISSYSLHPAILDAAL